MVAAKMCKKQGVPKGADPAVHERCVKDVKAQGHDKSSAFAICNASGAGKKKKKVKKTDKVEKFLGLGGTSTSGQNPTSSTSQGTQGTGGTGNIKTNLGNLLGGK